ncbi:MAG: hypothetical protein ABID63_05225 [Pseudomonadota bacterium]
MADMRKAGNLCSHRTIETIQAIDQKQYLLFCPNKKSHKQRKLLAAFDVEKTESDHIALAARDA